VKTLAYGTVKSYLSKLRFPNHSDLEGKIGMYEKSEGLPLPVETCAFDALVKGEMRRVNICERGLLDSIP
jgi:hypothetical protein